MATEAASLFVTLTAKTDQYTQAMSTAQSRMTNFTGATGAQTKTVSDNFQKSADKVHWWSRSVGSDVDTAAKDVEKGAARQEVANRRIQESMKGAASGLIALTAAYAGFSFAKDAITTTTKLTDETEKLSKSTGMSAKTASTWIETLGSMGVSATQAQTGFVTFERQIAAAEAGSKTAGQAFQNMGINMSDLKKGNTQQLLMEVANSLGKMTNQQQKAATAQLLFGRNTTALLPLMSSGSDKVKAALKDTQKYGDYIGGPALDKLSKLKGAQIDLNSSMTGLKIAFSTAVMPYLVPAIKAFGTFINQMRTGKGAGGQFRDGLVEVFNAVKSGVKWFVQLIGGAGQLVHAFEAAGAALIIVTSAMALLAEAGPVLAFVAIAAAAFLIIKNWTPIKAFFENLWTDIQAIIQPVADWFVKTWGDISTWFINAWNNILAVITPIIQAIGQLFGPIVTNIINGVASLIPTVSPLMTAFGNIFRVAFNIVKAIAGPAFDAIKIAIAPVAAAIKFFADVTISLIPDALKAAWGIIKAVMGTIASVIKGGMQIIKGIIEVFTGIFTGDFSTAWKGIKLIFSGALTDIYGILKGAWTVLYSLGKFIIQGLGKGVSAAFNAVMGTIVGFLNDVIGVLDKIPFVNIGKIKWGGGSAGGPDAQSVNTATGAVGHATGGKVTKPGYFAGEQAPSHPEFILATNPAYRQRNLGLWAQAGTELGVPGFQAGGTTGVVRTIGSILLGAGFNKIGAAGIIGNALQESSWNPASESGGNGGLWGFTSGNKSLASEQAFANSRGQPWTSVPIQTEFMLQADGLSTRSTMNNMSSPEAAASWFMTNWEAPAVATENEARRQAGAREAFDIISGIKPAPGILSQLGTALSAVAGIGADALTALLPSAPKLPGWISDIGKFILDGAGKFIASKIGLGGGGGSTGPIHGMPAGIPAPMSGQYRLPPTQGPIGVGSWGGYQVADWIIPELQYAHTHGWSGNISSGYRPGNDPGTATGGPGEHAGTQYPHGAVDFGGPDAPGAPGYNNRAAFFSALKGYKGLTLIPEQFPPYGPYPVGDGGHASGTGHFKGAYIPGFKSGAYSGISHQGTGYHYKTSTGSHASLGYHYDWQTGSYQRMTAAAYKALQSAWYSQHPGVTMPSSPHSASSHHTKKAKSHKPPSTSYHWNWQKGAFEAMTAAQYKALQAAWFKGHKKTKMPTGPSKAKVPSINQVKVIAAKRKAMMPKGLGKLLKGMGKKEAGEPGSFQKVRDIRQREQNYMDSFNHVDFLPTDTPVYENGVWTMDPTALSARMARLQTIEQQYLDPAQKVLNTEPSATAKAVKDAKEKHKALLRIVDTIKKKIHAINQEINKQQAIIKKESQAAVKAKTTSERTRHTVNAIKAQNRINDLTLAIGTTTKGFEGNLKGLTSSTSGEVGKYANTIPALTDSLAYYSDQSKIGDPNNKSPAPVLGFLSIPDRQKTLSDAFDSVHQEMAAVSGTPAAAAPNTSLIQAQQASALANQQLASAITAQNAVFAGFPGVSAPASSWTSFLGSFASGIANVPFDGMAAIHKGEAVIPASMNPFTGNSTGAGHIQVHLHGDAQRFAKDVEVLVDGKKAEIVSEVNNVLGFAAGRAASSANSPSQIARY